MLFMLKAKKEGSNDDDIKEKRKKMRMERKMR